MSKNGEAEKAAEDQPAMTRARRITLLVLKVLLMLLATGSIVSILVFINGISITTQGTYERYPTSLRGQFAMAIIQIILSFIGLFVIATTRTAAQATRVRVLMVVNGLMCIIVTITTSVVFIYLRNIHIFFNCGAVYVPSFYGPSAPPRVVFFECVAIESTIALGTL
jgi:cation transport ATPase